MKMQHHNPVHLLVADGGSTKTAWQLTLSGGQQHMFVSRGMNPALQDDATLTAILQTEVNPQLKALLPDKDSAITLFYYGAGCLPFVKHRMADLLRQTMGLADVSADSDLLGAARALCGHTPGIACILGTGSNSCFYENGSVKDSIRSGGFILGDEGSGADLGKRLLSDYIKGLLPNEISCEFSSRYGLDYQDIVSNVYRSPYPGRFLASFSPFIREFAGSCRYMHDLVKDGFSRLFERAVARYGTGKGPVGFAGSVAYHFSDILRETALSYGIEIGKIICRPADGLAEYHKIESGL